MNGWMDGWMDGWKRKQRINSLTNRSKELMENGGTDE